MAISTDIKKQSSFPFGNSFVLAMGPQRAGTSWLDRYLRERDDVCLPSDVKEIFFFDRHFERGDEFYASHFEPEPQHKFLMEISTTAFDHPDAPERVLKLLGPNITLLCPLRHPVIRSYSLYLHYLRYGIVQGTLAQACEQNPQIISSSRYAEHLQSWIDVFGKDNLHIVFQEELENDQANYIKHICDILKLPYAAPSDEATDRYNVSTYSRSGTIATLTQHIADFLRSYRLYFIINVGKTLGLKQLIFGKENPDAGKYNIPEDDRLWLEERLSSQIKDLEDMIGPVSHWE